MRVPGISLFTTTASPDSNAGAIECVGILKVETKKTCNTIANATPNTIQSEMRNNQRNMEGVCMGGMNYLLSIGSDKFKYPNCTTSLNEKNNRLAALSKHITKIR